MQRAFTMAGAGQRAFLTGLRACGHAFTMAEILLSLTIIGVVAAITLPSLTGNINERTWNTQRKALYARMSQAISLMPALNGYGTLDDATDTAAETFITAGLAKVMKINNICDNEHLQDCGIPTKIIPTIGDDGSNAAYINTSDIKTFFSLNSYFHKIPFFPQDTKVAAFETQNGESIITYYNPQCSHTTQYYQNSNNHIWYVPEVCVNFIYDLNGSKGPNTVNKDIGIMTVFYPTDSIVAAPVLPLRSISSGNNVTQYNAAKFCRDFDSEFRAPNIYEAQSIVTNHKLLNLRSVMLWTSEIESPTKGWVVQTNEPVRGAVDRNGERRLQCVKR